MLLGATCSQVVSELEGAIASTQQALDALEAQQGQQVQRAPPGAAAAPAAAASPQEPQAGPAAGPAIGPQLPPDIAGAAGAAGGGRQMHPRNKYATELPDFAALAEEYPSLAPYLLVSMHRKKSLRSFAFSGVLVGRLLWVWWVLGVGSFCSPAGGGWRALWAAGRGQAGGGGAGQTGGRGRCGVA